jgi:hypothetical protein
MLQSGSNRKEREREREREVYLTDPKERETYVKQTHNGKQENFM